MKLKNLILFFAVLSSLLFYVSPLGAQEGLLNKLLAPGPLMQVHQHLEKSDCLQCHVTGQGVPDSKCLDCHKAIQPFVTAKKGFHGLLNQACIECHTDHKGADFNSIQIEEKNFEHNKRTGYPLEGKHAEIKCIECHKAKMKAPSAMTGKTRFFGSQAASCLSCHKKDDVHQFKGKWAQKDCATCHNQNSWKTNVKFDHGKDTGYVLEGKHSEMKCADCHGPNKTQKLVQYSWPKLKTQQCLTCHIDQHKNNLSARFAGGNCTACHSDQNSWKLAKFDHKITKFLLKEKHAEVDCIGCHKQKDTKLPIENKNFKFTGLQKDCISCHKDYHHFGPLKILAPTSKLKNSSLAQCQTCHTEANWQSTHTFEHNKHTRYVVDGAHAKLNCLECHIESSKQKVFIRAIYNWPRLTTKTCENCHKSPHQNQFNAELLKKKCTECHQTSSWLEMKSGKGFDHSKTRFPLTGAHKEIRCSECHTKDPNTQKQIYKFKSFAAKFCIDCHSNIHKEQFSAKIITQDCTSCHTTSNFKERTPFNHSTTRYPLEGSHSQLECQLCHTPSKINIVLTPPNFHKTKDKLQVPLTLSQFKFPNVQKSECLQCHTDFHKGQLGANCLNCHNMEKWAPYKFEHNKQSTFALRGKHLEVKCQECHKPRKSEVVVYKKQTRTVTNFKPISGQCLTCHKDVHKGSFGSNCQECHVEKGWKLTKDFHKNFTLTGVHYALECAECHKDSRKLAGLSQNCMTCHAKDDVHNGTLPACQECHKQQFWEVSGFRHSLTQFPLRGAHRTINCMDCHSGGTYKGLTPVCASCHLQDALSATSQAHGGFSNLMSCNQCHLNQFSWRSVR